MASATRTAICHRRTNRRDSININVPIAAAVTLPLRSRRRPRCSGRAMLPDRNGTEAVSAGASALLRRRRILRTPSATSVLLSRLDRTIPIALTAAADPRERTYLRAATLANRRLSWLRLTRADDALRGAGIGLRHHPRPRRRRIDRPIGSRRRRAVGREGRNPEALPIPLGSESTLGLAGPNGMPDIAELPAPAEPAGGTSCANAAAGANRASAAKRTSVELRDIGCLRGSASNNHVGLAFPPLKGGAFSSFPSCCGVGVGQKIRLNQGETTS